MKNQRNRNTRYSVLIFLGLTGLALWIPWESGFAAVGLIFLTKMAGVLVGGLLLLLRLMNVGPDENSLFYTYFGVLNTILALVFMINGLMNSLWSDVHLGMLNAILGACIMFDVYRKPMAQEP